MIVSAVPDPQIEQYLLSLHTHLAPMPPAEREDTVREIAAHIQDSIAESGESATAVITRFGTPQEIAAQYNLRRASRSFSPLVLLRATLRYASKGVVGVLVFFCGLLGYSIAVGFVITALLKPIFPAHTGAWVANGHLFFFGTMLFPPQPPAHDVLGWWYTPIALAIGSILGIITMFAIRAFLKFSRGLQRSLATDRHTELPQAI